MSQFPVASSAASLSAGHAKSHSTVENAPLPAPLPQPLPSQATEAMPAASCRTDRLALNQLTTLRWRLDVDLKEFSRAGFPAIGVSWQKLTRFGLQRGIRRIQQSGLAVSSLGWIGGFTGENGYSLEESIQEARRMIRVAGQLRASCVTVICGPLGGHIRSHAQRLVNQGLQELGELAAIYNVNLALQPMHPLYDRNWSFIHTLEESLLLLDRVAHPSVKLAFGMYHLCHSAEVLRRIPEIADRVALVSLSDLRGVPQSEYEHFIPGEGQLPIANAVKTLEGCGYDGWYEIEVWSRDLWKQDHRDLMERCLQAGRGLMQDSVTC